MLRIFALVLLFSSAACTVPTTPLTPAVTEVDGTQAAETTDCHNEPNSSDDCNHNEPDN